MRKLLIIIIFLSTLLLILPGCSKESLPARSQNNQLMEQPNQKLNPNEKKIYQIAQSNVKLMSQPQEDSDMMTLMDIGAPVNIIEDFQNGWCRIRELINPDLSGFVKKEYLQLSQVHSEPGGQYSPLPNWSEVWSPVNEFEKIALKNFPELAQRDGKILTLKLQNGKLITFNDSYELIDYHEATQYFIIADQRDVPFFFLLINQKNGSQTFVSDYPIFSPDNKRFICTQPLAYGYYGIIFEIFNIEHDKPELEYKLEPFSSGFNLEWINCVNGWFATNIKWISNDEIEFTKNFFDHYNPGTSFYYWKDKIKFDKNNWNLQDSQLLGTSYNLLTPSANEKKYMTPTEFMNKFHSLYQRKELEYDVATLIRLGYNEEEILNFTPDILSQIFAPGSIKLNGNGFVPDDKQRVELHKVGINPEMSTILYNLGYQYDEMLKLSLEKIDLIFPTTQLIANLTNKGCSEQEVQPWALAEQGRTYKDLIEAIFTR